MAMRFVQDYGNNKPNWSYYYKDTQNVGHLNFGNNSVEKFTDLLVQSNTSPYFQLYLYNNGLDLKEKNSNFAFQFYSLTDGSIVFDLGRSYSHFASIYSDGLSSYFITQNPDATYATNLYSSLSDAGLDIYTPNYGIFGHATTTESYIGVQNRIDNSYIYLRTIDIPSNAGSKQISLREIQICTNGERKKMLVLASEPYSF
jgi:hypothetical protein